MFLNIVENEHFCSILHPFSGFHLRGVCWVSSPCSQPAADLFLSPWPSQVAVSLVQHPDHEQELEVWI